MIVPNNLAPVEFTLIFVDRPSEFFDSYKGDLVYSGRTIVSSQSRPEVRQIIDQGNFIFYEVGEYGLNQDWQYFRSKYGFTHEEKSALYAEQMEFLQEQYDITKPPYLVVDELAKSGPVRHMCKLRCESVLSRSQPRTENDFLMHDLLFFSSSPLRQVYLQPVFSSAGVYLGQSGQCPNCGQVFYSTQFLCDGAIYANHKYLQHQMRAGKIATQNMYTAASQLAMQLGISTGAVVDLYVTLGSWKLTEAAAKLVAEDQNRHSSTQKW